MGIEAFAQIAAVKCKLPDRFSDEKDIRRAICGSTSVAISESRGRIILDTYPFPYTVPIFEKWVTDDMNTTGTQPLRLLITFINSDGRRSALFIGNPTEVDYNHERMSLTCKGTVKSGILIDSLACAVENRPAIPWYSASYLEKYGI